MPRSLRDLLRWLVVLVSVLLPAIAPLPAASRPNIIVIFTDDQAYGDLGVYGSPNLRTPRIDRMATEGLRFTDFYVSTSVCSASRASLLTGRYPDRNGTHGVYFPGDTGLSYQETTIATMLRSQGYATACFGKWHLGDQPRSLPTQRGFDQYWGIPYSNDMFIGPNQPIASDALFREGHDRASTQADIDFVRDHLKDRPAIFQRGLKHRVPIMANGSIVEYPADQATLTRRYFDHAIAFIDDATAFDHPFFVYLTPSMPHVPLFASPDFDGVSLGGRFGDTIEEIDAQVGRLLDHLDQTGLSENTLIVFTTDNGPWLNKGDDAGSAGPLRDGKFSSYEGGLRAPAIMRWTGTIPAGATSHEIGATIDLLPTFSALTGAPLPPAPLDGVSLQAHLLNPANPVPRAGYFYYKNGRPVGVRHGLWKYLPHGGAGSIKTTTPAELYNLGTDISETRNVVSREPAIAASLAQLIEQQIARLAE